MNFENKHNYKNLLHLNYIRWMEFILRRSVEVGKVELPISAVILDKHGRCIGRGSNNREINNNPLGHAELIALRQASFIKNDWRFNDCIIITNLEPCTMCAAALVQARMGVVIYGAEDKKEGFRRKLIFQNTKAHKMTILSGILVKNAKKFKLWFKKLRSQT